MLEYKINNAVICGSDLSAKIQCFFSDCPPGYALNAGWCYGIQEVHFTQAEARQRCREAGRWVEPGDLADIRTVEENNFVYSLVET